MTGPQPKASARKAKAIELRAAGLRNLDIANQLGASQCSVSLWLKGCGVPQPQIHHPVMAEKSERVRSMVAAYRKGKTLQQIGDVFGVTRERIRQLMRKAGIDADCGGAHLRTFVRLSSKHAEALARKAKRIEKIENFFGCCYDEVIRIGGPEYSSPWMALKNNVASPVLAYMHQRRNATQRRGIAWEISLTEWWRIWQESGHWEQRGRGQGYCMARFGDSGPYSVDNVYICTIGQNFADSWLVNRRGHDAENKESQNLSALETQVVALSAG